MLLKNKIMKPMKPMKPNTLRITSGLILVTFAYFIKNSKKNIHEIVIGSMMLLLFFCSQLFWRDPIRRSIIHRLDAFVAKITIIYSILYTILTKHMEKYWLYFTIIGCIAIAFYASNYYSSKDWCCPHHIFCHCLLHIFCFAASLYVFI